MTVWRRHGLDPCRSTRRGTVRGHLTRAVLVALLFAIHAADPALAAATPQVTSVSPAQGSVVGGERVTINGSGFLGPAGACNAGYEIWFGTDAAHGYGIPAPAYRVLSDSRISVVVPANFGGPVDVQVHNACGSSPVGAGDVFTYHYPRSQCVSGTCSINITAHPVSALRHAALGFLDGFNTDAGVRITPRDVRLVDALHPRQWRFGQAWLGAPGGGIFHLARQSGARISLDLTSDWEDWAWNFDHASYNTPYGDLATYYWFIHNDVEQRLAAGQVPDFFDVWNEPIPVGSVHQWLSVYGTAYRAIKAADPSARVVGPSIDAFLLRPAAQDAVPGYPFSLRDFLDWEVSSGYRFAAISWHEDGTTVRAAPVIPAAGVPALPLPGGYRDYWSPAAIATHVRQAKALLSDYPRLRGTQVFVNEYGPTYAVNIPGWMVGDFQALEEAGANEGMITCATGSACSNLLDGMIGHDGAPQMPYWVMRAYSEMSGPRLRTWARASNLYSLATVAGPGHTVKALIGRADDCFGGVQCPQFQTSSAAPVTVALSLSLPRSVKKVNVTVQRLANRAVNPFGSNDVPLSPRSVTINGVRTQAATAHISLPKIYDGDALYVTVRPAS